MLNVQTDLLRAVKKCVTEEADTEQDEITLKHDEFKQLFTLGFCVTVYKYQGDKIKTHYNIYEAKKMDKRQLYTALSRTTKYDHLHVDALNEQYWIRTKNKDHSPQDGQDTPY